MSSESCRLFCRILIRALFGLNVLVVACNAFHRERNKKVIKNGEELRPSRSYHLIKLPSFKMGLNQLNDVCLFACFSVRNYCT